MPSAAPRITPAHLWWCLAGLTAAIAPHATRFALGMLGCFAALAAWRVLGAYGRLPLPDRDHRALWWLKQALALAAFLGIYIAYRGQIGRDAGVALLTALLGLKVLELTETRDFYVASFLAYFLVLTNFFYSQTMPTALYMAAVVVLITAGLIRFNVAAAVFPARACWHLAMRMVLQAVPVMVLGFLLFPRVSGPLWGMPKDAVNAVTGLSDSMTIGRITALGTSDEVAFRVKFDGPMPRAAERYWRGPVLWHTDGRQWVAGSLTGDPPPTVRADGPVYRYTMTMEATGERWLLGLDAVTKPSPNAHVGADLTLASLRPLTRRTRYTLESATRFTVNALSPVARLAALGLPDERHPRALALARGWRNQLREDATIIARALDYFREQSFVYTLLPPALPDDSIDQFLFETRAGFCEHYAASFVVLMRAAGIPARVVTGYQGGEFNDVGDYLIIRQRDAHAWAEVYLPERGWLRVDPTSVVAPMRLSLGVSAVGRDSASALALLERDGSALQAWRHASAWWEALNYQWSQWVLGYSPARQLEFLDRLGLADASLGDMTVLLTGSLAVVLGALGLYLLRTPIREDPLRRCYGQFCHKLARAGLPRAPHEGPHDYARRVTRARPDLALAIEHITRLYSAARYAGSRVDPRLLRRAVRAFDPGRA